MNLCRSKALLDDILIGVLYIHDDLVIAHVCYVSLPIYLIIVSNTTPSERSPQGDSHGLCSFKASPSTSSSVMHVLPYPNSPSPKWPVSPIWTFSLAQIHYFHPLNFSLFQCNQTISRYLFLPLPPLHTISFS